jgi:putative endonuclease
MLRRAADADSAVEDLIVEDAELAIRTLLALCRRPPLRARVSPQARLIGQVPFMSCPGLTRAPRFFQFFNMTYYVYMMASRRNGTLYIGVTNDLVRRAYEHREGLVPGFTKKYGVTHLVHFEPYADVRDAIQREKNLKHWSRA